MASGVISRLFMAGFRVIALEIPSPLCIRRHVCFAEACFEKQVTVEGVNAVLADSVKEAVSLAQKRYIPILIDPEANSLPLLNPIAVIDARMLKEASDASLDQAPITIGLGPGFDAGINCHAVVETNRGINLGRVIYNGSCQPDTGVPAQVGGYDLQRVLRSPAAGGFKSRCKIGDMVKSGQIVGEVNGRYITTNIDGILRGLIHDGISVSQGMKIGDIDPQGIKKYCYKISDKANAIAGGILEALLALKNNILNK
jgi:xanthine dehydrogenase accessory factor